ncbi:hypothetical protein [Moorena producens]|nr:hypothetical protein [Moorena producens]
MKCKQALQFLTLPKIPRYLIKYYLLPLASCLFQGRVCSQIK